MKSKNDRSNVGLVDTRQQSQQLRIPKNPGRGSSRNKGLEPTDRKLPFSLVTLQPDDQSVERTSRDSPVVNLVNQQQKKQRTGASPTVDPGTKELLALIPSLTGTETSRLIAAIKKRKTETTRQTTVKKPSPYPDPVMLLGTLEPKSHSRETVRKPAFQPPEQTVGMKQEERVLTNLTPTAPVNEAVASLANELVRRASRQELPSFLYQTYQYFPQYRAFMLSFSSRTIQIYYSIQIIIN